MLIAAGLTYVVNISSWGGHRLFGQLLVPAGVSSALIDLVVWMAIAIEQSYSLEIGRQQAGVKDLTRSTLKWPGAQSAILLQWTESPVGASATGAPLRYWQLMAQVNGNLIVSLIAITPAGEFDSAGLAKIVETFRPHA